jgi:hypothetical protein
MRLDPSDADFIDVIHTNGRVLLKVGLGLPQPIGEMTYFTHGCTVDPKLMISHIYGHFFHAMD